MPIKSAWDRLWKRSKVAEDTDTKLDLSEEDIQTLIAGGVVKHDGKTYYYNNASQDLLEFEDKLLTLSPTEPTLSTNRNFTQKTYVDIGSVNSVTEDSTTHKWSDMLAQFNIRLESRTKDGISYYYVVPTDGTPVHYPIRIVNTNNTTQVYLGLDLYATCENLRDAVIKAKEAMQL